MANGHDPLIDELDWVAATEEFKSNKQKYTRYVVAKYAKKAAKHVIGAVLDHLTLKVFSGLVEVPAVIKTDTHISHLEALREHPGCPCTCSTDGITCIGTLRYAIEQKRKKKNRKIVSAIPVINYGETIRAKGHALFKNQRGVERKLNAEVLHSAAFDGCKKAIAIIAELVGDYTKQESLIEAMAIVSMTEGSKILADKLAST